VREADDEWDQDELDDTGGSGEAEVWEHHRWGVAFNSTDQKPHEPTNQPTNQRTNQPTNQPTNKQRCNQPNTGVEQDRFKLESKSASSPSLRRGSGIPSQAKLLNQMVASHIVPLILLAMDVGVCASHPLTRLVKDVDLTLELLKVCVPV
jgi:hypothetical protein